MIDKILYAVIFIEGAIRMVGQDKDVKTKILLAAKKLFAEQGFDATTVRQICNEAGVGIALVSYHFGGKENVFYALFDHFLPNTNLEEIVQLDPIEGLKRFIQVVIRFRIEEPEMAAIFHKEMVSKSPRLEFIRSYSITTWEKLREILDNGRKQGLFSFQSLDYMMLFIMGTLIFPQKSTYFSSLVTEGQQSVEQIISFTYEFVLNGLKCKN